MNKNECDECKMEKEESKCVSCGDLVPWDTEYKCKDCSGVICEKCAVVIGDLCRDCAYTRIRWSYQEEERIRQNEKRRIEDQR